jgi:uncharacterized membrane protein
MFELLQPPSPPPFEGMHPLVVHLPIGVLVLIPLFILLAIVFKHNTKYFTLSTSLLAWIGTIGAIIAVITGHAAYDVAPRSEDINKLLLNHMYLAELTRNLFIVFSVLYTVFSYLLFKDKVKPSLALIVQLVFLAFIGICVLALVNTGHQGARLVHEFGIQSIM